MEGNKKIKARPRGLLIFGAPCSGKTTFAEKFAEKFGLAYYDLDILRGKGFTRDQIVDVVTLLTKTRQTIVIEGGIETEQSRTEIRNALRSNGYDPALIWLQTDISTIKMRMKKRYRSVAKAREEYDKNICELEAPSEFERPIILSGKHTFETQSKHALTGLSKLDEKNDSKR